MTRPGRSFEWRRLDRVAVVGRSEGTDIYELLGERGTVAPEVLEARDRYEAGAGGVLRAALRGGRGGFRAAAELVPGDKAAEIMARRAEQLALYQPHPNGTGSTCPAASKLMKVDGEALECPTPSS